MLLKDKVAIVTGGGRGIGEAIVRRFVSEGARVAICDLNEPDLERVQREINEKMGAPVVVGFKASVANGSEMKAMVEKVVERWGTVDILVNNAGVTRDGLVHKISEEDWDMVINVNLKGTFLCCQAVIPTMIKQKYGKIVNISSASWCGNVGQANYSASKAGVVGLTRTLAKELAPRGINVNAVAPGSIATDMYASVPEKVRQWLNSTTPLGRPGTVEEVASTCLFLASGESSYITGQVIECDGGMFMV